MRQPLIQTQSLSGSLLDAKYRLGELLLDDGRGTLWSAVHEPARGERLWYAARPQASGTRVQVYCYALSAKGDSLSNEFTTVFYERLFALSPLIGSGFKGSVFQGLLDFGVASTAAYIVFEARSLAALSKRVPDLDPLTRLRLLSSLATFLSGAHQLLGSSVPFRPGDLRLTAADSAEEAPCLGGLLYPLACPESTLVVAADREEDLDAVHYCAPEVLVGDSSDFRADIFAFGVLAYDMLFPSSRKDSYIRRMQKLHLDQRNSSDVSFDVDDCIFGSETGTRIAVELKGSLDFNPAFRPRDISDLMERIARACGEPGQQILESFEKPSAKPRVEELELAASLPRSSRAQFLRRLRLPLLIVLLLSGAFAYWQTAKEGSAPPALSYDADLQRTASTMVQAIEDREALLKAEVENARRRISELFKAKGAVNLASDVSSSQKLLLLEAEAQLREEHLASYRRWISGDRSGMPALMRKLRAKRIAPAEHATLENRLDALEVLAELYEKKRALLPAEVRTRAEGMEVERRALEQLFREVDASIRRGEFYAAVRLLDEKSPSFIGTDALTGERGAETSSGELPDLTDDSSGVSSGQESELQAALARARRLQLATQHEQAIEILEPFLSQSDLRKDEKSSLYFSLGRSYYKKREFSKAEEILSKAIALEPGRPEYHFALGNVYLFSKRYEQAVRSYEAALAAEPDNVRFLSNLGIALERNGDPGRARKMLRRAIELDPDGKVAKNALAELNSANSEVQ